VWEFDDKVEPLKREMNKGRRAASEIAVIPKPGSTQLQMETSVVSPVKLLVRFLTGNGLHTYTRSRAM
jgi:hypothetical protein